MARFDPAEVNAIGNVAGNWTGILDTHGLYGRMLGLIGLGEVGSLVAAWPAPSACEIGLMNHEAFARMRPSALFVNTSRGRPRRLGCSV